MTHLKTSLALCAVVAALSHGGPMAARQATTAKPPATPAPIVAAGRVEFTDPAGDIQPIVYLESVGTGPETQVKYPGFDVIKAVVSSDGKALTFAATLTAPPARVAFEVLEFYVDVDNNSKTGIQDPSDRRIAGVEYYGTLEDCLEHPTFGTMCAGSEARPAGHSAIVTLEKYGKEWMFKDTLVSLPASGAVKEPKKVAVAGALVQATLDYTAMGVKSGQTIRLVLREACAAKAQGYFPDVVLTLK